MTSPLVLLVDGRERLSPALPSAFIEVGYVVQSADDGPEALIEVGRSSPDVIVISWPLAGIDSIEFVQTVRRVTQIPLLSVAISAAESDALRAFDAGVDNFIPAPEDDRLIVARCDALLRLSGLQAPQTTQVLDAERQLILDEVAGQVYMGEDPVDLTATEYNLLVELATEPGRLVSREEIAHRVWEDEGERDARLIDPHLSRLRSKIEQDPSNPDLIRTVRGRGYRLDVR